MVFLSNNMWNLSLPEGLRSWSLNLKNMSKWPLLSHLFYFDLLLRYHILTFIGTSTAFGSRDDIFVKSRDKSDLAGIYATYISEQLSKFPESKGYIGALIIEPGKITYTRNFILYLVGSDCFCFINQVIHLIKFLILDTSWKFTWLLTWKIVNYEFPSLIFV